MSKEGQEFHVEQIPQSPEGIRAQEAELLERASGNPAAIRAAKRFIAATGMLEQRR